MKQKTLITLYNNLIFSSFFFIWDYNTHTSPLTTLQFSFLYHIVLNTIPFISIFTAAARFNEKCISCKNYTWIPQLHFLIISISIFKIKTIRILFFPVFISRFIIEIFDGFFFAFSSIYLIWSNCWISLYELKRTVCELITLRNKWRICQFKKPKLMKFNFVYSDIWKTRVDITMKTYVQSIIKMQTNIWHSFLNEHNCTASNKTQWANTEIFCTAVYSFHKLYLTEEVMLCESK